MRQDGFVSLWIGKAPSRESLDDFIRPGYDDDGNIVPSQFMTDFKLPRWDESCREAECLEAAEDTVSFILSGFSYDDQIIPQFERQIGPHLAQPIDAVVLLYNYNYENPSVLENSGPITLRFVGTAQFVA